ncbi:30S ribosomal protein S3 [Candidatus Woesearchaeota archaeon]|nr:30S ribosomal protein S3 [Candidatus Woesearchaeota archaeon]
MIERQFIAQKTKEYYIKKYIEEKLPRVGLSSIKLKKIPLGEKIIIYTSRPSLVVGSKGANIKDLTKTLKKKFHLENPQVEINEVKNIFLDAQIVAERIASSLERFGSARFKSIGHKIMENILNSGALGVELVISGKIPGARAKSWRFYQGYLKKCGDISVEGVRKAQASALLKTGIIGIKVAIMPPDLDLPDTVDILSEPQQKIEESSEQDDAKKEKKSAAKKKTPRKKSAKPKVKKEGADEGVSKEAEVSKEANQGSEQGSEDSGDASNDVSPTNSTENSTDDEENR